MDERRIVSAGVVWHERVGYERVGFKKVGYERVGRTETRPKRFQPNGTIFILILSISKALSLHESIVW
jgi:hypothetical protein